MRRPSAGPPYDPHCRLCEFGWIDYADPDSGYNTTRRCPDCQAKAEAMHVPAQPDPGRSRTGRRQ